MKKSSVDEKINSVTVSNEVDFLVNSVTVSNGNDNDSHFMAQKRPAIVPV